MSFSIPFSSVMDFLATLHGIADEKRTALRGRLQHFQKLRFPAGINTGKGRRAEYGASALVQMALALEMAQLGMTPERVVDLLSRWPDFLREGVERALESRPNDAPGGEDVFVHVDPRALEPLMIIIDDSASFGIGTITELAKMIEGFSRLALINLSVLIYRVAEMLPDEAAFRADLTDWAKGDASP